MKSDAIQQILLMHVYVVAAVNRTTRCRGYRKNSAENQGKPINTISSNALLVNGKNRTFLLIRGFRMASSDNRQVAARGSDMGVAWI
jgi:hypothetical protein